MYLKLVLFTILLLTNNAFAISAKPLSKNPIINTTDWHTIAKKIACLNNKEITAIEVVGDKVYVGTTDRDGKNKLYIYDMKMNSCVDVSQHLRDEDDVSQQLSDKYDISSINYDDNQKRLWITTCGNGMSANSYDLDLNFQPDPDRHFLISYRKHDEPGNLHEKIFHRGSDVGATTWDLDINKSFAVVSLFKENTYSYDFTSKKTKILYTPDDPYQYSTSVKIYQNYAILSSTFPGKLVLVNLNNIKQQQRFISRDDEVPLVLKVSGKDLWVGTTNGLYQLYLPKFVTFLSAA